MTSVPQQLAHDPVTPSFPEGIGSLFDILDKHHSLVQAFQSSMPLNDLIYHAPTLLHDIRKNNEQNLGIAAIIILAAIANYGADELLAYAEMARDNQVLLEQLLDVEQSFKELRLTTSPLCAPLIYMLSIASDDQATLSA